MLEREGNRNLKVYFYNFPREALLYDINYLTLPCPQGVPANEHACLNAKNKIMNSGKIQKGTLTEMGELFLTGMYGKSTRAMMSALAKGAQINPEVYKAQLAASKQSDDVNSDDAKELGKIIIQAANGSLIAKIKLSIAMSMKGKLITPVINEITGRLPVTEGKENLQHGEAWDHLTDYTHHKLLVVDGNEFILGGRNVEDSYHMSAKGEKGKYVFMDTDFWAKTEAGGAKGIEKAFDKIVRGFMVKPLDQVKDHVKNGFIANLVRQDDGNSVTLQAIEACNEKFGNDFISCVKFKMKQNLNYKTLPQRLDVEFAIMTNNSAKYTEINDKYGFDKSTAGVISLNGADLKSAKFHYLENLVTFDDKDAPKQNYGSRIGQEHDFGKNIQAAWYAGLQNVCKVSREQNQEKRVIFHSAYLLMPSGMVHQIGKMMNGDYGDCSKVRITFLTNSPFTTDLGPINVLARYQLGALFTYYRYLETYADANGGSKFGKFYPKLEYYEYNEVGGFGPVELSLHTKTSLIGDVLIVGSANADVRSYCMDTNNALMIRNAYDLNKEYTQFVDSIIKSGRVRNAIGDFEKKAISTLEAKNQEYLKDAAIKYKKEKNLSEERMIKVMQAMNQAGKVVFDTTNDLLLFRNKFKVLGEDAFKYSEPNAELNKAANEYDNLFKVF